MKIHCASAPCTMADFAMYLFSKASFFYEISYDYRRTVYIATFHPFKHQYEDNTTLGSLLEWKNSAFKGEEVITSDMFRAQRLPAGATNTCIWHNIPLWLYSCVSKARYETDFQLNKEAFKWKVYMTSIISSKVNATVNRHVQHTQLLVKRTVHLRKPQR